MTKGRTVLGRGLASLLPGAGPDVAPPPGAPLQADDGVSDRMVAHVELSRIQPNPFQPRAAFDAHGLEELRRSIQEKGVIQPVTLRRHEGGYQLISGERRVRAAREAGLAAIPAYIISVATNEEMLELALIENLQREELNPIEVAISYRRLLDECSYTQEELAGRIGKDRSTVANSLRLLRLPEPIQAALRQGQLTMGHARSLVAVEDPAVQMEMFQKVLEGELSVRAVERWVRQEVKPRRAKPAAAGRPQLPALSGLEDRLRQTYGTKAEIRAVQDGSGQIILEFYSVEDLDRIVDLLLSTRGQ
jgi:ParB family chromosome partitioning protein